VARPAEGQGARPESAGATVAWPRIRAGLVHLFTASGVVLALLAAMEISAVDPDPARVFVLLAIAVLVDAADGPLARRWEVARWSPGIDGRTIDDIVDYLTYTFLPLLLVWRMGWVPEPAAVWIVPALVASLFGFAAVAAKDEAGGFFLGFPSYWNVVAFYAGIGYHAFGAWSNAAVLLLLAVLTVTPIRMAYPNRAPGGWRTALVGGGLVWLGLLLVMLVDYPRPPPVLIGLSLVYPAFYLAASLHLRRQRPRSG
jgi:phosphatidylcholine synthase